MIDRYMLAHKLFELIEAQTYCLLRDNLEDVLIDGQVDLTQIAKELALWVEQQGTK